MALTRGGKYRNTPADTQVPYLETVFAFLGMTDVHFVYAEGLAMGPDAEQDGDRFRVRADRGSGRRVTQDSNRCGRVPACSALTLRRMP